tara:strand:+ start:604 stop:1053 length:450 start_codon:yes stop_codon:yes gene_type:complete
VEPITVAVTAFTAVKSGIKAGRELQDMVGELGKLWGGLDTARASHNQKRTKAMKNEFISVEEEALKTFADKRKADEIEKELREFIIYTLGGEAWNELIDLRGKIRKQRQEEARAEELQRRRNQEIAAVIFTVVIGVGLLWGAVYFLVIK